MSALVKQEPHAALVSMLQILDLEAGQRDSGDDASLAIMGNILASESEDELWEEAEAGTTAGRDFCNRPFRLMGPESVTWMKSGQNFIDQGGFPFYALARVVDAETGAEVVLNCGGKTFVASLYRLCQFDDAEREIRSFEPHRTDGGKLLQIIAKPVASGNTVLILRPVTVVKSGGKK